MLALVHGIPGDRRLHPQACSQLGVAGSCSQLQKLPQVEAEAGGPNTLIQAKCKV